jgi:plasmid stabilization system protein ParE
MRIRFTPTARSQFLKAVEHIQRDKPRAASEFRKRAEKSLRRLIRFPNSGRSLPEFPELPYREVVIPPYRFFYRVEKKTIWIVTVWHGAQLPSQPER